MIDLAAVVRVTDSMSLLVCQCCYVESQDSGCRTRLISADYACIDIRFQHKVYCYREPSRVSLGENELRGSVVRLRTTFP